MMHLFSVTGSDGHVYENDDVLIGYYEAPHAITKRNRLLSKLQALSGGQRDIMDVYRFILIQSFGRRSSMRDHSST